MKKKIISVVFLLTALFSTCMVAFAEDGDVPFLTTASQLKSKGAIVYQNGTDSVVIDSNDLYILADAFDSFKAAVYSQMTEMNTYLTTDDEGLNLTTSEDIYVVHSTPSDRIDPLSINFDTLVEGLAASQSIPHTPSEYGYAEGTTLYKTAAGRLTTEASDETEMIEIEAATADNLSAGASAWVDGELILGNGNEVEKAYNQGVKDGVEDANLILSGLYLNLSVGEAGYGDSTNARIPVENLNKVSFTVNKGFYGQLVIRLTDKNGMVSEYKRWYMKTTLKNEPVSISLNKNYGYISFSGVPHGGSGSTITISNFSVG